MTEATDEVRKIDGRRTRIKIVVSEGDIERARVKDSYRCVVAQAIARCVPDATRIEVDTQLIRFTRDGVRYGFLTPYAVQGYIVAFDAGEEILPFSFQLRDPKQLRRRVWTEAGKALQRVHHRKQRREKKTGGSAPAKDRPKKDDEVESVKAAYEGQPRSKNDGGRYTPRVFKLKKRDYGHRLLRINQAKGAKPPAAARDEEE